MSSFSTIAVGFDGSDGSLVAPRWAMALATRAEASIAALGAVVQPTSRAAMSVHDERLDQHRSSLRDHGLPEALPLYVFDGDPRQVLATSAATNEFDVEVVAVHVRRSQQAHDEMPAPACRDDAANRRLARWSEPLESSEVTTTAVSVAGTDPAVAILDLAAEKKASMLVIGTRGIGGFGGLRFGGQATRSLHRALLPLSLVPVGRDELGRDELGRNELGRNELGRDGRRMAGFRLVPRTDSSDQRPCHYVDGSVYN